jgi:acetoin utilization deacetylase AcuC-like enzyme
MLTFASDAHRRHHPRTPFHDQGRMIDPPEVPERAERIRAAIAESGLGPVVAPESHGLDPILRVHSADYVEFLEHAFTRWRAATGAPLDAEAVPYARPVRGQPRGAPHHPIESFGWYSPDNDAVLAGTWEAAIGAVDVTMSAWSAVAGGAAPHAYALARPPGHHATADSYAGYCFLNNAAIAAAAWADRGARVAILDVDYHHGNGTQQIFWSRPDVCFVSLHADPAHEYPFFSGYADEQGTGPGTGTTHNYPLPLGTDWSTYEPALADARDAIRRYAPDALVVSLGVDTAAEDADTFQLVAGDYPRLGAAIAQLGRPTLFVQEGGYDLDVIGRNVTGALHGFEAAANG